MLFYMKKNYARLVLILRKVHPKFQTIIIFFMHKSYLRVISLSNPCQIYINFPGL